MTQIIRNLIVEEFSAVVGLECRKTDWYRPDGDVPVSVEGTANQGDCVVLTGSGEVRVEQVCLGFRRCEASRFSECAAEET